MSTAIAKQKQEVRELISECVDGAWLLGQQKHMQLIKFLVWKYMEKATLSELTDLVIALEERFNIAVITLERAW